MATKTETELLREVIIYPFLKYDGITFLPVDTFKEDPEKQLRCIKNLESRPTDVLLCTTMKSGSHWVHEILSMLANQTTDYNTTGVLAENNIEYTPDFDELEKMKNPRLFHTHLPYRYLPRKHIDSNYKIIYLNRNPKDRWVSQYTFLNGKIGFPKWQWKEFFENIVLKDDMFDGWFTYTREFEKICANKTTKILKLTFEDLKINQQESIKKIADFIGCPHTEKLIEEIADKCSFEKIKVNKIDDSMIIDPEKKATLFRKGIIGDWKNWFTVAQNEQFDELYRMEMKGVDVNFIYENGN